MNIDKFKYLMRKAKAAEDLNSQFLHLTVNENQLSRTANQLLSSKLSERYFFGSGDTNRVIDFGSYTFRGMPEVSEIVNESKKLLEEMTGAKYSNLNCFSGLHAMMCTILISTLPGDTVMSLHFEDGGHLATKGIVESLGRKHVFANFDLPGLDFDYDSTIRLVKQSNVKALYIDISVHLNTLDIPRLKKMLPPDVVVIYDVSHSLGLILGGMVESPIKQGVDIICSNTHKTFAGPQGGLILFADELFGSKSSLTIDTTFVSSVNPGRLLALSVSIFEYSKYGKAYAKKIVANSRTLAASFVKLGYDLRKSNTNSYSNNEQVHLFLGNTPDKKVLYQRLLKNHISTNFMYVLGGRLFARIGTQEVTRRGMGGTEMRQIAKLVDLALNGKDVKGEVLEINKRFSDIKYSFDTKTK